MGIDSYKDEIGGTTDLLQARVNNAIKIVDQAEIELRNAEESMIDIWQNRLDQRKRKLEELRNELDNAQAGV